MTTKGDAGGFFRPLIAYHERAAVMLEERAREMVASGLYGDAVESLRMYAEEHRQWRDGLVARAELEAL